MFLTKNLLIALSLGMALAVEEHLHRYKTRVKALYLCFAIIITALNQQNQMIRFNI
jgi:hypothetical protein